MNNNQFKHINKINLCLIILMILTWELIGNNRLLNISNVSIIFMLLTIYLILISILISIFTIKWGINNYLNTILFLGFILLILFYTNNLLIFYTCFELSLIPMFILIIGWGYRAEKTRAAYYLFFFTLIGGMIMLTSLVAIYSLTGTLNMSVLTNLYIPVNLQKKYFVFMTLAFLVKIPSIPFHIWLPQAHVEAPLAGSLLLAGIMLKLGAYGIIIFGLPLMPHGFYYYSPFFQFLGLISIIYGGLSTVRQSDMKRLIAYSSVAHMGFATYVLFNIESQFGVTVGITSCILILVAHGLVSPALFIVCGILYEKFGTRIIKYYGGLHYNMPILSAITCLFLLCSVGIPPSFNFWGELLVLVVAAKTSYIHCILISFGAFVGLCYSLYFFMTIFLGGYSGYLKGSNRPMSKIWFISLILCLIPVLFFGFYPMFLVRFIL